VGGVVISPDNLNFSNEKGVDTPRQVAALTNQLQALAYGIVLPPERALEPLQIAPWPPAGYETMKPLSGQEPGNIPLLIAVEQAGDGLPNTALRRGFTPLPSQMAIGATWSPQLAQRVGEVVGRELHAVGVNMLLGPSLDVFDQSSVAATASRGINAFGGSPFWVSELGRAYISGVHNGGGNQVASVARHFPGQGSSDRPPEEEVATIQKSLQEMRETVLPPFVAATQGASSVLAEEGDPGSTDVIMTSHMRYSAFQGGAAGRVTPISLAPELNTVFTQEGFDGWRDSGGVVMSNSLGVPAIRRFYGTAAQNFFNRRVALDAFLAGNDLLYLADFSLEGSWESEMANIMQTIGFFQDRYNNDADFAARVDASVRRILRLKLGLYRQQILPATGSTPARIPLPAIMVGDNNLEMLGGDPRAAADNVMNDVARQAITILYPDPAMQTEPLPPTFRTDDKILVFSDSRLLRECSTCTAEAAIGPDELADIIKNNYGSEATGQIDPTLITSLTFAELTAFLDYRAQLQAGPAVTSTLDTTGTGTATGTVASAVIVSPSLPATPTLGAAGATSVTLGAPLTATTGQPAPDLEAGPAVSSDALAQERLARTESLIRDANWIVFAMLDVDAQQYPASEAVPRFLSEYGDDLTDQRLVVLALNAPYFLDATEMSRLTTYFGVYGKTQAFLENAVRALFRGFSLTGAPPVAVPGTRFASLADRLAPDPARSLPLQVVNSDESLLAANAEALAEAGAEAEAETPLQASVDVGATVRLAAGPIIDRNGHIVADGTPVEFDLRYEGEELSLALEPVGTRDGIATRDLVIDRAGTLRVAATAGAATSGAAILLVIVPPPTPIGAADSGATPDIETAAVAPALPERVNLATLVIALFTIVITLSLFLIVQVRVLPRAALVHNMLWAAIFGLLGYLLYGAGLFPAANWLRANVSVWGTTVVVFIPMLLPLLWLQLRGEE